MQKLTSTFRHWKNELFYLKLRDRISHPEVFLENGVLKIYSKFTGEYPCQSVISIKLLCNFIEITLRHGCSPVNLLYIFRTPFLKNTSGRLLQKHSETTVHVKNCLLFKKFTIFTGKVLFSHEHIGKLSNLP